eukprot:3840831-Rhodomonas_salina.1
MGEKNGACNQPTNQSTNQSINQSKKESKQAEQASKESVNQSINPCIKPPIRQYKQCSQPISTFEGGWGYSCQLGPMRRFKRADVFQCWSQHTLAQYRTSHSTIR